MAKKVRGARSSHRPGGLGPSRTRRGDSAGAPSSVEPQRQDADIDGAIERVTDEPTAFVVADPAVTAPSSRKARRGTRARSDSLEARVAAENVYVAEDIRRIALLSIGLIVALLIAWVLLVPLDLAGLY